MKINDCEISIFLKNSRSIKQTKNGISCTDKLLSVIVEIEVKSKIILITTLGFGKKLTFFLV